MRANPNAHQHGSNEARFSTDVARLERSRVTASESHTAGDNVRHTVFVRSQFLGQDVPAQIATTARGDAYVPDTGTPVLVGYREDGKAVILATLYEEGETIPEYDVGERVIGHNATSADIRIKPSGAVEVTADDGTSVEVTTSGEVHVNGGGQGVITDVSTTKDPDGHVTSINLTRSSDLFVP